MFSFTFPEQFERSGFGINPTREKSTHILILTKRRRGGYSFFSRFGVVEFVAVWMKEARMQRRERNDTSFYLLIRTIVVLLPLHYTYMCLVFIPLHRLAALFCVNGTRFVCVSMYNIVCVLLLSTLSNITRSPWKYNTWSIEENGSWVQFQ